MADTVKLTCKPRTMRAGRLAACAARSAKWPSWRARFAGALGITAVWSKIAEGVRGRGRNGRGKRSVRSSMSAIPNAARAVRRSSSAWLSWRSLDVRRHSDLPEVVQADIILQGFGLHAQDAAEKFGFSGEQIRRIAGDVASGTGASFNEIASGAGAIQRGRDR